MALTPVTLTSRAVAHIERYLSSQENAQGLRLGVKTTGCSGLSYTVAPATEIDASDRVFDCDGVKIVVASEHLPYLAGIEVDYAREGLNESFKFSNPNVKATCGCGESFTV
jgi:iron-sulfur cluster assembly protein